MLKIRTEAKARGLSEEELIRQLETGRLSPSAVFPALKDQLAFESWLEERAAAERAACAERAARELASLVYEIESERQEVPRGFRVRFNHVLRNLGAAVACILQGPPPDDRESLSKLTPVRAWRQGLGTA